MSEIQNLKPSLVWKYFDEITRIPRPSKKEGKILTYLDDFAKKHSLKTRKDEIGNLVILKKASKGYEELPTVVLQSHVDMVAEKNSDTIFNFDTDPIHTYIEGDWVKAKGTTLGADDGIGMAAQLAILASDDLKHGPLECLFTVDEETGLTGAFNLGENMLTGKYLINLDSEDEGEIFIGCAGGMDTVCTFKYTKEEVPKNYIFFRIEVSGLKGGHSGEDINKGRGNSNKILNRFLRQVLQKYELRLSHFDGGNLRNAIPREASAVFGIPVKATAVVLEMFGKLKEDIKEELGMIEPTVSMSLFETPVPRYVVSQQTSDALINALCGVPNGILAMSSRMENLVETSTNLASVKFKSGDTIEVTTSQRSTIESGRDDAALSVESVFTLAGAEIKHSDGYPGWTPDPSSVLLETAKESYEKLFGKEPRIRAIHAGLECGLFLRKYPWMDMISIGPTLEGVHSPDERLEIPTVNKFWKLLLGILEHVK